MNPVYEKQLSQNIKVIDFNQRVEDSLKCRKTRTLFHYFNTTICLRESENDTLIDGKSGENDFNKGDHSIKLVLKFLLMHPNLDFIDIGAQNGVFTMYAATLGRSVVSIECFPSNIRRIHLAVQLENLENRVTLIQNALHNKSGEYRKLRIGSSQIGSKKSILKSEKQEKLREQYENDPFIVKTIEFNDLLELLINRRIRSALMKVDIQGSEVSLFESGNQIFDHVDIPCILMKWLVVNQFVGRAEKLIDNLRNRNYKARDLQCNLLDFNQHLLWPIDIVWLKLERTNFC